MNALPSPDSSLQVEVQEYLTRELGPACVERFKDLGLIQELHALIDMGVSIENSILRIAHHEATKDRDIADEFLGHFLLAMMRVGHLMMSEQLNRFLDTDDLVNSVAGDIWRDLEAIEFRTRSEFLAYLGTRLKWKAAGRHRAMNAGKRREDLRQDVDLQAGFLANESQETPSVFAVQEEEKALLSVAMIRLPERDKRIMSLFLGGASNETMAHELELELATARQVLKRAIAKTRALI